MIAREVVADMIRQIQRRHGCTCNGLVALAVRDADGAPVEPDEEVGDGDGLTVSWSHQHGCPLAPTAGRRFEPPV